MAREGYIQYRFRPDSFERDIPVVPARPLAVKYANAILALVRAEAELERAKEEAHAVNYRPVGEPEDDYAEQSEAWNRAADALLEIVETEIRPNAVFA